MPRAEQITGPDAAHGEGPLWWPGWGGLRWVDLEAGDVLHLDASGTVTREHLDEAVGCIRPRAGGGMAAGVRRGFALFAADGSREPLTDLWDGDDVRMNDGACDPAGRFWCGSMEYQGAEGRGSLYRLDPDRSMHVVRSGLTIPNGLDWTADGGTAFHTDSPTRTIEAWTSTGEYDLVDPRPFATLDAPPGQVFDGLTVDAEGGVWVAVYGGSRVQHHRPDGSLAEVIEVDAVDVTACTFGGADLDELWITTSRRDHQGGGAGALFRYLPGVSGQPARTFAG